MKQLSVFLENRAGTLKDTLHLLKDSNIQLFGICLADVAEYGLCRILCSNPQKACEVLQNAGLAVSLADVFALEMDDVPGGAHKIVSLFAEEGVSISYLYSFNFGGKTLLAVKVDNAGKANGIILDNNLKNIEL